MCFSLVSPSFSFIVVFLSRRSTRRAAEMQHNRRCSCATTFDLLAQLHRLNSRGENNEWTLHKQNFINKYAIDLWPHCYSRLIFGRKSENQLFELATSFDGIWRRHKCRCEWSQEDRRLFCCKHFVFDQMAAVYHVEICFLFVAVQLNVFVLSEKIYYFFKLFNFLIEKIFF